MNFESLVDRLCESHNVDGLLFWAQRDSQHWARTVTATSLLFSTSETCRSPLAQSIVMGFWSI